MRKKVLSGLDLEHIKDILVVSALNEGYRKLWGCSDEETIQMVNDIEFCHVSADLHFVYFGHFIDKDRHVLPFL